MDGAPPFFTQTVGARMKRPTGFQIATTAAALMAALLLAAVGKHLRVASSEAGVVAGMQLNAVESTASDGEAAYTVVIGMTGDRSVEVPVRFIVAPGSSPITPAQAREALHAWIRKRAIDIGRLSSPDVERKPTIYISMDDR